MSQHYLRKIFRATNVFMLAKYFLPVKVTSTQTCKIKLKGVNTMIIDSLTFSADLGKSHYDEVFEFDSDSASALQLFSLDRINSLSELALDRYEDILDLVKVLSEADRSEEATTLSAHLAKSLAYATGKVTVYFHDSEDATHRMIEVSNYRDNIYPQVKNFLTSNLPPHVEAMKIFLEMNDSFLDSLDEVAPIDSVDDSDDGLELPS